MLPRSAEGYVNEITDDTKSFDLFTCFRKHKKHNLIYVDIYWVDERYRGGGLNAHVMRFVETHLDSSPDAAIVLSSITTRVEYYERNDYIQADGAIDDDIRSAVHDLHPTGCVLMVKYPNK